MKPLLILLLSIAGCAPAYAHPINMDAIAEIESSNNPKAVGKVGEIGLYQISPIVLKHYNQSSNQHGLGLVEENELLDPIVNHKVAEWYMNWLFDRCWTVRDTIIAWNFGIGNWRSWKNWNSEPDVITNPSALVHLPKITQDYLKKYEKITGEKL